MAMETRFPHNNKVRQLLQIKMWHMKEAGKTQEEALAILTPIAEAYCMKKMEYKDLDVAKHKRYKELGICVKTMQNKRRSEGKPTDTAGDKKAKKARTEDTGSKKENELTEVTSTEKGTSADIGSNKDTGSNNKKRHVHRQKARPPTKKFVDALHADFDDESD